MVPTTLLSSLLGSSIQGTAPPPLVVISDTILCPGLILLRQFVQSALVLKKQHVILLSVEQVSSKILPSSSSYSSSQVTVLDQVSPSPFASTSSLFQLQASVTETLERKVLDAISAVRGTGTGVLVVVDSVIALEELVGSSGVFRIFKKVLRALEKTSPGSSLITLHHASFPSANSTITAASLIPALLPLLISPQLSPSTVHLSLHPPTLFERFSKSYGLLIPLSPGKELDPRIWLYLPSFAKRNYGDPLRRPLGSKEEDERIPLDVQYGSTVVEYCLRGYEYTVGVGKGRGAVGTVKPLLTRGFEGIRKASEGVESCALRDVLRMEEMGVMSTSIPLNSPPVSAPVEPLLPFNLSLTESQKLAREEVVLPFLPKEQEGGKVEYTPDEGDDMDEDDPDEDLEI